MEQHERWLQLALEYCCAASELNDADTSDRAASRIAPSALCLGFGIELFLKAVLMRAGQTEEKLRHSFGHDLQKLWEPPDCEETRRQAALWVDHLHTSLSASFEGNELPEPGTFDVHLRHLSDLHSAASGMALRYPVKHTMVPQIRLIASVFEALIRSERNGSNIARV